MRVNTEIIRNNTQLIGSLREELDAATDSLRAQQQSQAEILRQQQDILTAIATPDEATRSYVPRLSANMKSPTFAEDFRQAVSQSYPEHGTLVIVNKMAGDQEVGVNNQQHTVAAGASVTLTVPRGTVMLRLPNQDPVPWVVGPPDYRASVAIVSRRTALMPSTSPPPSAASVPRTLYLLPPAPLVVEPWPFFPGY